MATMISGLARSLAARTPPVLLSPLRALRGPLAPSTYLSRSLTTPTAPSPTSEEEAWRAHGAQHDERQPADATPSHQSGDHHHHTYHHHHACHARPAGLPPSVTPEAKRALEEMLRVDHAGEWGAVRIYEGQMAVLGKTPEGATLREMAEHERGHLRKFQEILPQYRVRPTALLPVWDAAGYALGFGSALLGKEAAYAVTVAVETVITEHYNDQLRLLHERTDLGDQTELRKVMKQFRDEEQEHLETGLERDAEKAPFYQTITDVVHAGCKAAIWVSKRV